MCTPCARDTLTDREQSKKHFQEVKGVVQRQKEKEKVKIKLNKPLLSEKPKHNDSSNRKMRPRYQICVPSVSLEESFDNDSRSYASLPSDFALLQKQVGRYDFVRRYLG
jgi:hypothetical protein